MALKNDERSETIHANERSYRYSGRLSKINNQNSRELPKFFLFKFVTNNAKQQFNARMIQRSKGAHKMVLLANQPAINSDMAFTEHAPQINSRRKTEMVRS